MTSLPSARPLTSHTGHGASQIAVRCAVCALSRCCGYWYMQLRCDPASFLVWLPAHAPFIHRES